MQREQIQLRNASIALLTRADTLCRTWSRHQSTALALFQSLSNILAQRTATLDIASVHRHGVQPERLMYKQTVAFEETLVQLQRVMTLFQNVLEEWNMLERNCEKHLAKHLSMPQSNRAAPLSTESLIQVAAIQPDVVHTLVANLCFMHRREYNYKTTLLSTLPQHCNNTQDLDLLVNRWDDQSSIDKTVHEDIIERLKLYNFVKKVVESKD
ncbi:hypothetical protein DFQ28_007915 [Apophysomyces sp. BC1034]|nr:hypothetical protein DFQ30_007648 [Apophysomyces sp. BC1015]KAG0176050.1 hypothetical protein DFQ29_006634 [Apophysomyces sp. BC1021]KAG0186399.1 hypothetical protein DFQ28_007915 [Apophysomyces sp. BC1034]